MFERTGGALNARGVVLGGGELRVAGGHAVFKNSDIRKVDVSMTHIQAQRTEAGVSTTPMHSLHRTTNLSFVGTVLASLTNLVYSHPMNKLHM